MKILGLLVTFLISSLGVLLLGWSFTNLSFNWEDFLMYLVFAAISYLCIRLVGGGLDKSFNQLINAFIEGKLPEFEINKGQLHVFGFLLVTLLPFLVYLMLFSLYSAIVFGIFGFLLISYLPRVPIALILGLIAVVLGTGYAVLLGFWKLFFPSRGKSFGVDVEKTEQPRLWKLMKEISEELQTRTVDKIVIKPDSGIGVYQDGNIFSRLAGKGTRILEVGIPSIHDLKLDEFKAIIAHEYGHFSNRDTQWGAFTYFMGTSLLEAFRSTPGPAQGEGGGYMRAVMSINPAYWLLFLYILLYFKITNGFSRIREVMADIRAMKLYGSNAFADGLLKVATNDYIFSNVVESKFVPDLLKEGKTIKNMSKMLGMIFEGNEGVPDLKKSLVESRQTHGAYDSHPSLGQRIKYAERLNIQKKVDTTKVESLFDGWDELNEKAADLYSLRLMVLTGRLSGQEHSEETKPVESEKITNE